MKEDRGRFNVLGIYGEAVNRLVSMSPLDEESVVATGTCRLEKFGRT